MNLEEFHSVLEQQDARGYELNSQQREAVDYNGGPLWIIAGPGSGKTEVLVTRTLRLLCVEPRVAPRSMLITTFTKKAARNLEDRLASYMTALQAADSSLQSVDLADLRVGTIHSLCNDILQEYRAPNYQNVRLLDEVDQHLFVYKRAEIANNTDLNFWRFFGYAVLDWNRGSSNPPNKWQRTKTAVVLFNHIVEDVVDVATMSTQGGYWATLAAYYSQYAAVLAQTYRCDWAHLQLRFLEFLNTPAGQRFLNGDGADYLPLEHILVDEYQDTNPIQERIYLALGQRAPYNIAVVGDDDQALYRFRGGTVAGMVNFDRACQAQYGIAPRQVPLLSNYRSHPAIVDFFNNYIESHPEMRVPGTRAPGKQSVVAASSISGAYPAVGWISRSLARDLPAAVADLVVDHLIADGIISDYSQCAILFRSTKDSPQNAGPYIAEFRRRGVPIYNPRSKSFMEAEEVQTLLAAVIRTIDLDNVWASNQLRDLGSAVQEWINTLQVVESNSANNAAALIDYITRSNATIRRLCQRTPGGYLDTTLHQIIYRILACEPFPTWQRDPERNYRLSKVTRLIESYHSMGLDTLRAASDGQALDTIFLNNLYYTFLGYLIDTGIDDDEDDEVVVPQGMLPFMTIHQSKGLEFPFVVVTKLGGSPRVGVAQILEGQLTPFRRDLYPRPVRTPEILAFEDDVRLYYVAYSRAEYGLILVATQDQLKNAVSIPARDFNTFRWNTPVI